MASPPATASGWPAFAGIGFTVSIFVAGLAFDDPGTTDQAKFGVLLASVIAAAVGSVILMRGTTDVTPLRYADGLAVDVDGS